LIFTWNSFHLNVWQHWFFKMASQENCICNDIHCL
jgi:hypothetical protein